MELDFFSLRNRKGLSLPFFLSLFLLATVVSSPAQTFTTLASFSGTVFPQPWSLIQGTDGNFYGTTVAGGANNTSKCALGGCGSVFKITPTGTLTTLYSFCAQTNCADGANPEAGLVQATDGNFYGTTSLGGAIGAGTVFKITPGGTLTTLHSFNGTDGGNPGAALVQGNDGNLYGTTNGTVFKITAGGALTTLYMFCLQTNCPDGQRPGGLVQATDGNFYGTTNQGGANSVVGGTVFKITAGGALTTLYSFCAQTKCTDGDAPVAGLVQGADGNFYGTTLGGGANGHGTVFKISPGGTLTTLHSFCGQTNCPDGSFVNGLVQATDGSFYGTTFAGGVTGGACGTQGCGTVFKITPMGTLTTLYSFLEGADGGGPQAGLVQATDGNFYGTTTGGGANGLGTVFRLSLGLTKPIDGDFDGDHKSDIAVWRPSTGTWFVIPSSAPNNAIIQQWGASGDIPVRGDYDGDRKTDFAVWRPSTGTWFIIPNSNPSAPIIQQWGTAGDIPVPGDYDGDGKTDFAVWRPSTGTWFIIPSSNPSGPIARQWGTNGDIPVPGDYDGDGKTDFAVFRPSTGTWFIIPSSNPSAPIAQQWGTNGDIPVPGDYDGDGKTDFAVWRPSNGVWFIIPSSNPSAPMVQQWGIVGDMPVPLDYDGDLKTDIAVWRPSSGTWFVIPSSTPAKFTVTQWGISTDVPVQKPIGQ